jgi:hypothetical protein
MRGAPRGPTTARALTTAEQAECTRGVDSRESSACPTEMARTKAKDVFTPGAFPTHTYVARDTGLEAKLRNALSTTGQIVSLSGPSKAGKTVLVEKVVGKDNLIPVSGASIEVASDVWERALDWMGLPHETTTTKAGTTTVSGQVGGKAEANVVVAKGEVNAGVGGSIGGHYGQATRVARRGLHQVQKEIAGSDFVLLLDDFHYMPRAVQDEVAKQVKEAVRLDIKIVTAAVTHRADDVIRANPELRGRVMAIDLDYWRREELTQIASLGFQQLNASVGPQVLERFATESAGSPQLMQAICLQAAFLLDLYEARDKLVTLAINSEMQKKVLEATASVANFRSLFDVLDAGPPLRGQERKTYTFNDGTEGDVYRCVLKAIAAEPLLLSFDHDDFQKRVRSLCKSDPPVGSSITSTCSHMSKLALDKFPRERVIDWDETKSVLDIPDPYLMFFLRWSGCLQEESAGHR